MRRFADYAAAIAPHVDRLVLAVHRQPRVHHADEIEAWRAEVGLDAPGLLINLRPFVVDGVESRELLERLHRYQPSHELERSVRAAVDAGLITDEVRATPKGVELAARLTELQRTTINELWAGADAITALVDPLTAVVDGLPDRYHGEPFALTLAFASLDRPKPPGPYLVHHLLTVLRYLRADAHSEVLLEAELSEGEAARLDRAWRELEGTEHPDPLPDLVLRGLVTADGDITEDGRTYRVAIEHETNSVAGSAWDALDESDRAAVLEHLGSLPDHMPDHHEPAGAPNAG